MKRFIAILLSIIMVFSLSACGGETMTSSMLSINIKGSGKKEMKVTVTDQFEDIEYELEYFVDDSEEPIYQVAVTKEEAHSRRYSVTGVNPGTSSWSVRYIAQENVIAQISMDITVNEALHVSYSNIDFSNATAASSIEFLDAEGNPIAGYMTIEETGIKYVQLSNNGGWWEIGTHDESVVRVTQKEIEDEDTDSVFKIEAIAVGATMVYFINPDIDTQVVFDIETRENTEEGYILIIKSYTSGPMEHFTTDENALLLNELEQEFGETLVPDDAFVKGVGYNKGDDFATVQFKHGYLLAEYTIIRGETAQSLTEYMTSEIEPEETLKMKLGEHDANYIYFKGGVAVVFWDEEGQAIRMDFTDTGKDSKVYKEWLAKYMPPVEEEPAAETTETTETTDSAVTEKN